MKVKDLPITITPDLNDFAISDLASGLITQKTTWQKIKDLFLGISPADWQTIEIPLTELDMQTLNSANAGLGFKIFPALPLGKIYQLANARLNITRTPPYLQCWSTYPAGVCYIYDSVYFNFHFFSNVFVNNVSGVLDGLDILPKPSVLFTNSVDGIILNNAPVGYPVSAPAGSRGSIQIEGGEQYLWTDEDYPSFTGSAKLKLDFRILNI
jgi:hypothetical protein